METGEGRENLNTGEGGLFPILTDNERASREPVIQHGSRLQDLQILIANVLDSGNDPEVGHGRNFVGGGRERDLKTTDGADRGLGVNTDGRNTKNDERQREHSEAKKSKDSWIKARDFQSNASSALYSWNAPGAAATGADIEIFDLKIHRGHLQRGIARRKNTFRRSHQKNERKIANFGDSAKRLQGIYTTSVASPIF